MKASSYNTVNTSWGSTYTEHRYACAEAEDLQLITRQIRELTYHPETTEETRAVCSAAMVDFTLRILALTNPVDSSDDPSTEQRQ